MVAPDESHIPISFKLNFEVTNNEAEYEACITGMEAALEIGVDKLEIIGDSALVISQSRKEWKVKDKKLKPYHEKLQELTLKFHTVSFMHIPRMQNRFADALATLASMIEIPIGARMRPLEIDQRYVPSYLTIAALEEDSEIPWFTDVWDYIEKGVYPQDASEKDKRAIRRLSAQFIICGGSLYRRTYHGMQQLCVTNRQGAVIMERIHAGVCGPHMNGHMLAKKILRQGYYWTTMEKDCAEFVKRCWKCQKHANLMHVPPRELYSITTPWPFSVWGIDIIRKVTPKAANNHEFILVAIDYFTKWVEAAKGGWRWGWRSGEGWRREDRGKVGWRFGAEKKKIRG